MIAFSPNLKVHYEPRTKDNPARMRWHVIADLCLTHELRNGAEIGVKKGVFTDHILDTVPGSTMIAVDPWRPTPGYPSWPHEQNFREFMDRIAGKPVRILRMLSHDAAQMVPDGSLDFVFIDGDHSYEAVKQDIADWTPKVRYGGIVSGHDINKIEVEAAVTEAFAYEVGDNKVWWCKR